MRCSRRPNLLVGYSCELRLFVVRHCTVHTFHLNVGNAYLAVYTINLSIFFIQDKSTLPIHHLLDYSGVESSLEAPIGRFSAASLCILGQIWL